MLIVVSSFRIHREDDVDMDKKLLKGHLAAISTVFLWGTTFISTKVLLEAFSPAAILVIRFVIGYFALLAFNRRIIPIRSLRNEIVFASAGLTGVCLYYLLENMALTYTQAANVSVVVSSAPLFTFLLSYFISKGKEKVGPSFIIGFILALLGIALISFAGSSFQLNPFGDFLSLVAAAVWAFYAVLTKKIASFGFDVIQTTRRVFFYGIIFIIPFSLFLGFEASLSSFLTPINLLNFLYLGIGASAACFAIWNYSVAVLGPVKTSVYIYAIPLVTVVFSVFLLDEKINLLSALGMVLALLGLFLSNGGGSEEKI